MVPFFFFSVLTDIDINALNTSSINAKATPIPCRLNSDVFYLPGLSNARQRSSIAGETVNPPKESYLNLGRSRLGTNASDYKSKNFLNPFRIPNMLQSTKGTANRYSLIDDTESIKVIYSSYEKSPFTSS